MSKKHLNIRIFGLVQGVSFRYWAVKKAKELNLQGFARNESGNSVYLEVEGEESALGDFKAWCGHGPDLAQVEKIEVEEGEMKNFKEFLIDYEYLFFL